MVVTWDELFQFCLVIIGIVNLAYLMGQAKKK